MSKDNKPQMITINDVEYDTATFTEEQIAMTNHCLDLDQEDFKHELPVTAVTSG
jgi:hypothetical protein